MVSAPPSYIAEVILGYISILVIDLIILKSLLSFFSNSSLALFQYEAFHLILSMAKQIN